ncbi:MAG: SpoIID/LytB domain-containing protein [Acidobacteriota bacterium]|nr:SpoIID/LytB domain-containing protein [Acidobacteriota bacterium]
MFARSLSGSDVSTERDSIRSARWLVLSLITLGVLVVLGAARNSNFSSSTTTLAEDDLDRKLQQTAIAALGDQRGTIIVMDAQTGRIRAVVNPDLGFEQGLPPGSTIKPFTALAALKSGVITDESRTVCREEYADAEFHTVCSHPRDLAPLNPTEAIAYSCNYYFGKVGERLNQASFVSTLNEFGFGRKTGVNATEGDGKLSRSAWRPENAIGETDSLLATPIQLLNAYTTLVNGGHQLVPRMAAASGFQPQLHANISINAEQRNLIVKGMRGAVRYGTAETARLYSLPIYVFGKTGTATQINGFRTQGWFVGFASDSEEAAPEVSPASVKLAVLVFLWKAHGSEAAQVARPIFQEYARLLENRGQPASGSQENIGNSSIIAAPPRPYSSTSVVRVHLVRENTTSSLALEEYVRGVVAAEGSTESEPEALKALAIASRTYALKNTGRHAKDGYDFCSTTHCQRFRAVETQSSAPVASAVVDAVSATRGEVLRDDANQIVDAYFSASCGGATANVSKLWGGSAPIYLRGVRDDYCATEPHHDWSDVITHAQLLKALQSDPRTNVGGKVQDVSIFRRDETGRAELIAIKGDRLVTIKGWEFKIIVGRALGWHLLKSSRFEVSRAGSDFVFRGSGFGHGLGLCQAGAHVMAVRGASYRQILAKYFPGTRIASDDEVRSSADLIWSSEVPLVLHPRGAVSRNRQILTSEDFRINYPDSVDQREAATLLTFLQSTRESLTSRVASSGVTARMPSLEIFINETTGDFVGRTGQPAWAAAATKGNRIELQPLATLRRRRVLETTLRHELVHTLVDAIGRGRTPRWLAEGLAIHFAGEGRLVSRYEPRARMTTAEIERKLVNANSADDMRAAYAAAYSEVKRLIGSEGEAMVWRRVAG